jgi:uncharacterized protein
MPLRDVRFRSLFRALAGGAVIASVLLALAPASLAADMAEIRKLIAQDQMFDAFRELMPLAQSGNAEAQYELAGFYHWGTVGAANFTKARQWYERSAKQGNADAMIGLAVMNGAGQGGPVDRREAVKWLVIASTQQSLPPDEAETVNRKRDEFAEGLSSQDMEKILAESRSFVPKPEN